MTPLVSVVIPTRNRPELLLRAVNSVLAQTYLYTEIVVVIDGPDKESVELLEGIQDVRLRVVALSENVGGSEARNVGVRESRGAWIAFLDDDDEWLPHKIAEQMNFALLAKCVYPVISCKLIGRTPLKDYVWPRRLPLLGEDIGDYLFVRKNITKGEAIIQSSTILTKKELLQKYPFNQKLKKHQDTEWVIKVSKNSDTQITFVDKPLVIWNIEGEKATVSSKLDWHYTLKWLLENKSILSSRAIASYILTQVSVEASQQKDLKAIWTLLYVAFKEGKPGPLDLILFTSLWVIPRKFRRRIRAMISSNCKAVSESSCQ